jgi:hypothetical protein
VHYISDGSRRDARLASTTNLPRKAIYGRYELGQSSLDCIALLKLSDVDGCVDGGVDRASESTLDLLANLGLAGCYTVHVVREEDRALHKDVEWQLVPFGVVSDQNEWQTSRVAHADLVVDV